MLWDTQQDDRILFIFILSGMDISGEATLENIWAMFPKPKLHYHIRVFLLLGIYPKEMKDSSESQRLAWQAGRTSSILCIYVIQPGVSPSPAAALRKAGPAPGTLLTGVRVNHPEVGDLAPPLSGRMVVWAGERVPSPLIDTCDRWERWPEVLQAGGLSLSLTSCSPQGSGPCTRATQ